MLLALSAGIGLHGWPEAQLPISSESLQLHTASPASTKAVAPPTTAARKLVIAPHARTAAAAAATVAHRAAPATRPRVSRAPVSTPTAQRRRQLLSAARAPKPTAPRPAAEIQSAADSWKGALQPPAPRPPSVSASSPSVSGVTAAVPDPSAPSTPATPASAPVPDAVTHAVNQAAAASAQLAQQATANTPVAPVGDIAASAVVTAGQLVGGWRGDFGQ